MYSRLKTVIFLVFIISSSAKCRKGTNKPLVLMRYSGQQLSIKVKLTIAHPHFSVIGFTSKSWMFQAPPDKYSIREGSTQIQHPRRVSPILQGILLSFSLVFREMQFHRNRVMQGHWLFSVYHSYTISTGEDWLKKILIWKYFFQNIF